MKKKREKRHPRGEPAAVRAGTVCGLDVSAINAYRYSPVCSSNISLEEGAATPLSAPVEVWHFDFLNPPEESNSKVGWVS